MEFPDSFFVQQRPHFNQVLPDNWLATSALQKAIRRGQETPALLATSFLIARQPDRFWRRLVVIALEDIGIADLHLVHEVLSVSGRKVWRAEHGGDWSLGADLVQRLCKTVKCRDACDALVIADLHPNFRTHRSGFLDLGGKELAKILSDPAKSVGERVLAAWLIAGTKRFPAANLPTRTGSFVDLLHVYDGMGIDPYVLATARLGSTRTNEGHPLSLPLIWLLAATSGETDVLAYALPTIRDIRGWPDYAYDMHTRVGRRAIKLFQRECNALDRLVSNWLPPDQHELFVGTLVFRLEGEKVDRRLTYPGSQALLRASEVAHLTHQGLPETLVSEALSTAGDYLDLLHHCRTEAVRGYAA
jgi:hypothetical protein